MSHIASRQGLRGDRAFEAAYWEIFDSFFGGSSGMIKATLLARVEHGDTGSSDLDRVCLGLRQTMGWAAEAIEKKALERVAPRQAAKLNQASENRATT